MKQVVTLLVVAGGAYWVLGMIMQSQQHAAIASCGGPLKVPAGCPALDAVNQKWKWYPQFIISL